MSGATRSDRLPLLRGGEARNRWGTLGINLALSLVDEALDGQVTAQGTLLARNGFSDEARNRVIDATGDVVIPAVPKWYVVRNRTANPVAVSTGTGRAATVQPGTANAVACDGVDVLSAGGRAAAFTVRRLTEVDSILPGTVDRLFAIAPAEVRIARLPPVELVANGWYVDISASRDGYGVDVKSDAPIVRLASGLAPLETEFGAVIETEDGQPLFWPFLDTAIVSAGTTARFVAATTRWIALG